ncbi:TonB-dependent receptor [Algiphilus sp. W345]|uniref:TonB-dependent receptor n=1 Tax=Banduia mediterranea TaxID=3075609 RepID=A0ABU2WJQ5_9GAMM|nr:TonB-dependent receptor [Algiphilus sp. W345]MDT0498101.1 TonB-dependent receptor [Algiphilus sp. W345]
MTIRKNPYAPASRLCLVAVAAACLYHAPAFAGEPFELPMTLIEGSEAESALNQGRLTREDLDRAAASSSDVAELLRSIPGVSANGAGGFSSLPSIHGLNDDRVRVVIDGVAIDNACPNHMNPPLSYTDPQTIATINVIAGITPVSLGGDSIGGTIAVESAEPRFADIGERLFAGQAGAFYRSNGDVGGGQLGAMLASDRYHLAYSASGVRSHNYEGGDGDGEVRSTEYEKLDQTLKLAMRTARGLVELDGSLQHSPYEGFPNQYMDMSFNRSAQGALRYRGSYDWGTLDTRAYYRDTEHEMNFLADKGGTANGGMPMVTRVRSAGYRVSGDIELSPRDSLRVGNELQRQTLNDYWPAVEGSMMMGPDTYVNVNDAYRTRLGSFAEWQARWSASWTTLLGVRNDIVWMNTGDVQPYSTTSMMSAADAAAAEAFNAVDHDRQDSHLDLSALARYQASEQLTLELGYARKTRSPNLYERYAWGRGSMSSRMIGWYGDGNGYVGNLELEPETADTFSASARLQGGAIHPWQVELTPYYTRVHDYIDAMPLAELSNGFSQLQLVNQSAELYGVDLSAARHLFASQTWGGASAELAASWVRGKNREDGGSLYHQMPPNAVLTLQHQLGAWENRLRVEAVAAKTRVDDTRVEPETGGYTLIGLATAYRWQSWRLELGVDNLLDKAYTLPLGGQSLGDFDATGVLRPVPGRGRSINIGVTMNF